RVTALRRFKPARGAGLDGGGPGLVSPGLVELGWDRPGRFAAARGSARAGRSRRGAAAWGWLPGRRAAGGGRAGQTVRVAAGRRDRRWGSRSLRRGGRRPCPAAVCGAGRERPSQLPRGGARTACAVVAV